MSMEMQMQQEPERKPIRCRDCRFWSERLAQAVGGGPVEAYCLVDGGPFSGRYTVGAQSCDKGKSNQYGAIDDPYEDTAEILRLYAADDAAAEQVSPNREVQCADCGAWIDPDASHTCRQQVARNRKHAALSAAQE